MHRNKTNKNRLNFSKIFLKISKLNQLPINKKIIKIRKMRKIRKTICTSLILTLFTSLITTPTASAAGFTDVPISHKNYESINYLKDNNIVNGYIDGTFQPNKSVNRAEFLKIVIEGSNIPTDILEPTTFNDIDNEAWYGKYIRKANHEGWINGYEDGSFKPMQTINKVEALKILGKAQSWSIPPSTVAPPFEDATIGAWYISYLSYAKTHNFLEETGNIYNPEALMTRAMISEVIYRTIVKDIEIKNENETVEKIKSEEIKKEIIEKSEEEINIEIEEEVEEEVKEETEEEIQEETKTSILNFTPVLPNTISTKFFSNIILDEKIPNTFYKDEIYFISGTITEDHDSVTVILNDNATEEQTTYSSEVTNQSFEIPIYFKKEGNYNLGLLPGKSGSSHATRISVLPILPKKNTEDNQPNKTNDLDIEFENNQTFVKFNADENTINKIIFTQNNKEKTYISRQDLKEIPINYRDFNEFKEGVVNYKIESATIKNTHPLSIDSSFISSNNKKFTATTHQYSIKTNEIDANPPETINNNQHISFSGTISANAALKAFVIKPDGFTESFDLSTNSETSTYFSNPIIESGGSFNFDYIPTTENSTYIIEINDQSGEALLNHPVYIGNKIPLLPDYFDNNTRELYNESFNLNSQKIELLNLINEARAEHNLSSVTLSSDISNFLAQPHADDMAENDYFDHVNLQNQTPADRRAETNITTSVSENIAKDVSMKFAHLGLMRSATHRSNILNPEWNRVGLGIAEDDGYLIVVQEFSTNELTSEILEEHKNELLSAINNKRNDNGVNELTYNLDIEAASNYLNNKAINEGLLLNKELFLEALREANISESSEESEAFVRVFNLWNKIQDSIVNEESTVTIMASKWEEIGIDIQLDNNGNIHTTLIINHN